VGIDLYYPKHKKTGGLISASFCLLSLLTALSIFSGCPDVLSGQPLWLRNLCRLYSKTIRLPEVPPAPVLFVFPLRQFI